MVYRELSIGPLWFAAYGKRLIFRWRGRRGLELRSVNAWPLVFSERYGHVRIFRVGPIVVRALR